MARIALTLAIIVSIIGIIVILWQRQPRAKIEEQIQKIPAITQKNQKEEALTVSPQDGTVLKNNKVKFEGKTNPQSYVLIYTNDVQKVAKSQGDGTFSAELSFKTGLNLAKVTVLSDKFENIAEKNLTFYVSTEDVGNAVVAGSVKSTFDNLVTITGTSGDKNVRTYTQTVYDQPAIPVASPSSKKASPQPSPKDSGDVRVGDFAIALGDTNADSISAKKVILIRQDKPQNKELIAQGQIITDVKQNLFSIKNTKDGQIVELKLGKNSDVQFPDKDGSFKDISKDKTVIIFYSSVDKDNIPDLIWILQ